MAGIIRKTVVALLALAWFLPTYLLVVNGLTSVKGYDGNPRWLPNSFGLFSNIRAAWKLVDLGTAMADSLYYAVVSSLVAVLLASLAAFASVIMPVRRRLPWFWIIYAGTLLPLQVFLRPLFLAYANTGLYDSQVGMLVIYVAIAIPFAFFVLRNFATTVPTEVVEAARIDGASWWRLFWSIHVPLSKSAMIAAFVFQFVAVWNDLLFGITLATSRNIRPVMAALADLQGTYSNVSPPVVLAGALVVSLPTVVVFLLAQRFFVSSLKLNV